MKNIETQKRKIELCLRKAKKRLSRQELAKRCHIPINQVCYRVDQMMRSGTIENNKSTLCTVTGEKVQGFRLLTNKRK